MPSSLRAPTCAVLAVAASLLAAPGSPGAPPRAPRAPGAGAAGGAGVLGTFVVAPTRAAAGSEILIRTAVHVASSEERSAPRAGAAVEVALRGPCAAACVEATPIAARATAATGPDGAALLRLRLPDGVVGRFGLRVETAAAEGREAHEGSLEVVAGARVLLTTDKPLYQPGQLVRFRALALRPIDLRPVGGRELTFEVEDPRGNLVLRQVVRTSRFGVAAGELRLAGELSLGAYKVRAAVQAGAGTPVVDVRAIDVARYSPPKLQVTISPDRPYERPGALATGTIEARYFFGKPVGGGAVTLEAGGERVRATTGPDGRYRYQVPAGAAGRLELRATVRDGGGHEESAARTIPVEAEPFHVELVAESGALVPGVDNELYVTAVAPDGEPVRGARVRVGAARGVTDEAGVATLLLRPPAGAAAREELRATVVDPRGQRVDAAASLARVSVPAGAPLVLARPARVLVGPGQPLEVDVLSAGGGAAVYVEAIKDGQPLRGAAAALRDGRARLALPADDALFGTITLRAEVVDQAGRRSADERLVHVERARALRVEVRADRDVYAPGERATLRFRTVDAATGAAAVAQLGVVMVDDAILAMTPLRAGLERTFFTLAAEAARPRRPLAHAPGGYTMERLLDAGQLDARRERIARVLLAGAVAPGAERWEVDPWAERRAAWRAQARALPGAVATYLRGAVAAGVRGEHGWRFREDLFAAMAGAGALEAARARDPWGRAVTPGAVAQAVAGFSFDALAAEAAAGKLERAWRAVAAAAGELPRQRLRGRRRADGATLLTQGDLRRLVAAGDRLDPWGTPLRVRRGERYRYPYYGELLTRDLPTSAGPDGRFGSADDLVPPGDEYLPPGPGQPRLSRRGGALRSRSLDGSGVGEAYGLGGLGMIGTGAGGGGVGFGYGRGAGTLAGRSGSSPGAVTAGRGGGARVRESFPETMLWRPDLVTDARGEASLGVTMADSITTFRLLAVATAEDGRLGSADLGVRVFQDFFVDLDLPPRLTQGDEVAVPVAVYNYQRHAVHVALHLDDAPGLRRLGPAEEALDLAPGQVGVRRFRLRAERVGRVALTLHATGGGASDAVRREVEVAPDGVAVERTVSDRLNGAAEQAVELPADAIDGASSLFVKISAGAAGEAIDGLDGMLRMPSGCFEQTSSTTYPNALILDYLRRTRSGKPATLRRAEELLEQGYQRLLSFEVAGGGFSWFGDAPANQVLTAYGLQEFFDMARVRFVDPRVLERTARWLEARQRPDGAWDPDAQNIADGAVNAVAGDRTRTTAYVALALARTGHARAAVGRALGYLAAHRHELDDPYALALAAGLFAERDRGAAAALLGRLWPLGRREAHGVSFGGPGRTLTYGDGRTGRIETTALVAEALLAAGAPPSRATAALDFLVSSKDAFGSWSSTQATVLSLRALLASVRLRGDARGEVQVALDGVAAGTLTLEPRDADVVQVLDLGASARPGRHRVTLRFRGQGAPTYQVVARAFRPRAALDADEAARATPAGGGAPRMTVAYDRTTVRTDEAVIAHVTLEAPGSGALAMPVAEVGLPPGFTVDEEALERLVAARRVEKLGRSERGLVVYLSALRPGRPVALDLPMRARMPARVQAPASALYEYYQPERRVEAPPVVLTVEG